MDGCVDCDCVSIFFRFLSILFWKRKTRVSEFSVSQIFQRKNTEKKKRLPSPKERKKNQTWIVHCHQSVAMGLVTTTEKEETATKTEEEEEEKKNKNATRPLSLVEDRK